jgi:hypothetical protein
VVVAPNAPNLQCRFASLKNPAPVTVTVVPPITDPNLGLIDVMAGQVDINLDGAVQLALEEHPNDDEVAHQPQ